MTTDKRGISALLLQRQLGLGCYETAWMMLHKFRRAMVNLEREPLRGELEVDDTWIGGTQAGLRKPSTERPEGCPRHRRSREAGKSLRACTDGGHPRLQERHSQWFVQQNVAPASTIYTDGLKSFVGFEQTGFRHIPRTQPLQGDLRKGAKSVVPFADRAIGNLQQWLIGTYHGVSRDQLQVYLDEFVFRHNRRQKPMAAFQTLLGLSTACRPVQYTQIKGASDLSRPGQKTNHNLWGSAETTSRKCLVAKENACQRHGKGKRT